ncbi:MAG: imidazole glycerol phosphate synthase subunit HisH [Cyanobacteriota bacterium]|jgi:glutamine amidotransferase
MPALPIALSSHSISSSIVMLSQPKAVGIIDYGTGNIASLDQAFAELGATTRRIQSPEQLHHLDAVVLPGVGHFGPSRQTLQASGVQEALISLIRKGLPTLGICLGFQLLTDGSDEAPQADGLAFLPLRTERLRPTNTKLHKVPHLGWNSLEIPTDPPKLLAGIAPHDQLFYFANAYAIPPNASLCGPQALYQHERPWLAMVEQANIHGVQFHPEKSRSQGLQLLRNFLAI